jgi:branched-chain amino acid transport system permease protein
MFYREAGQFKTTYSADQSVFPIRQDRWFIAVVLLVAYFVVPVVANEYWLQVVLIPLLIFSLAAIGLNLLVGYAGQLSLGTGAFMAVGAYSTFKLTTAFPDLNIVVVFLLSGVVTAGVGVLFGLPSLRIKGFYLAVATLAAQFFLIWMFNKVAWFTNYDPSGSITAPPRDMMGITVTGATATAETRYILVPRWWPRIWCVAGSAGRGWRSATWTSPLRSSESGRCRPSCSPSRSARSTAGWPVRCISSVISAAPRPKLSTSSSRSTCCS